MAYRIPLLRRDGSVSAVALVDCATLGLGWHRWFLNNNGYAARRAGERVVLMHREILGLKYRDGQQVDHVNRDKLDNRRANLRVVDYPEQAQNRPSYRGSSSRFRAVYWAKNKRRWRARPRINGTYFHLGYFKSEIAAAEAVEEWRREHMPFAEPDPLLALAGVRLTR